MFIQRKIHTFCSFHSIHTSRVTISSDDFLSNQAFISSSNKNVYTNNVKDRYAVIYCFLWAHFSIVFLDLWQKMGLPGPFSKDYDCTNSTPKPLRCWCSTKNIYTETTEKETIRKGLEIKKENEKVQVKREKRISIEKRQLPPFSLTSTVSFLQSTHISMHGHIFTSTKDYSCYIYTRTYENKSYLHYHIIILTWPSCSVQATASFAQERENTICMYIKLKSLKIVMKKKRPWRLRYAC